MDQIAAFISTKKKVRHAAVVNSITEGQEMQNFDEVDDTCHEPRPVAPPSPRNRSHSVSIGGFIDMDPSMQGMNAQSTDQILSKIESLPQLYRRSHRRIGRLNTQLLEAVEIGNVLEVQRLLEAGANPNATCHIDFVSVCHFAALTGDDSLPLLLKHGAEKFRTDRMGRTPLHVAAWAGHIRHLGLLLDIPEAIQKKLEHGEVTLEVEEEMKKLSPHLKDIVNTRCELGEMRISVPKDWRDGVDHNCSKISERLPFFQPGWTPLHAASCSARHQCVRLLLAAGAEPCFRDVISRTPLDVAGSAYYAQTGNKQNAMPSLHPIGFAEVVTMLLATECRSRPIGKRINLHTPLHTAVELESLESIGLLLLGGASPANLNREGLTPLHVCVKKRLKQHLQAFIYSDFKYSQSPSALIVDLRDKDGNTVLHSSVLSNWLPGVCLALEAGANIISRSYNGETALHSAADLGNLDILKEILVFAKVIKAIDKPNKKGETALFKAVRKGNIECAKMFLKQGASIEMTLPDKKNVFHVAAEYGLYDMLKFLLDYNYTLTRAMVNHVTTDDRRGYGPIHFAAIRGHIECVKLLLSRNAFINLKATCGIYKGSTPLHIAARKNNIDLVKLFLKNNHSAIYAEDVLGWNALHTACYYASRGVIKLLLKEGADISAYTGVTYRTYGSEFRKTAIQLIMNNVSKPTEFIEEIFDSYINCNNTCPQDPNCEVIVDYGILIPNKNVDSSSVNDVEMKVVEAILMTGNKYDQRRLLIHPFVESFLCLKWEALLPFFYTMLMLYGLFVMSLTIFILSVYFYRDSNNSTEAITNSTQYPYYKDNADRPEWLNYTAWAYVLYFTISLIVSQEILYMNVSRRYFLQLETWVKFSSIALAILLPQIIFSTKEDWPRHIATIALLLSWLQMTFLLSRFPKWGYYVLMFRKVSIKVLKILLTFVFLVIGFALSFMIEYRSKIPFEDPWAAFVKTMVMMTSEFDYDDLVDKKESKSLHTSMIIIRLLFFIFLILGAIVLMNLMVAVAVNDLNDLEVQGNIMRLEKQTEFLASLETVVNVKFFMKILPMKFKHKLKFARGLSKISLRPCEPSWSYSKAIPAHVRDAIIDRAQSQKDRIDDKVECENLHKKIDHVLDVVTNADKKLAFYQIQRTKSKNVEPTVDDDLDAIKKQIDSIETKIDTIFHYVLKLKQKDN